MDSEIAELKQAKEKMINDKDAEIRKYKERIDEMSSDFAQILKSCLEKMSERIDFGNQTYEGGLEGSHGLEGASAPGLNAGTAQSGSNNNLSASDV